MTETPRIFILTDNNEDAEALKHALTDDYPQNQVLTDPSIYGEQFVRYQPQVVLFAFRSLGVSETQYVNLHRSHTLINTLPHVSLVLCDKIDARRAYELCRDDVFDDYVLFWPMGQDARRLPMSVRTALRALNGQNAAGDVARVTAQARRITTLDAQIQSMLGIGRGHAAMAQVAIQATRLKLHAALDEFANPGANGDKTTGTDSDGSLTLRREVACLNEETLQPSLGQAVRAMQQINGWIATLKSELAGPLDAMRAVTGISPQVRLKVLVIDDDDIIRKLLKRVLGAENYAVDAVGNAFAALKYLRTERPDLILMDVQMPSINGIQLTRKLKEIEAYADIPIIMLTGKAEQQTIVDSRAAGAADCLVKPFERAMLLATLRKHGTAPPHTP